MYMLVLNVIVINILLFFAFINNNMYQYYKISVYANFQYRINYY